MHGRENSDGHSETKRRQRDDLATVVMARSSLCVMRVVCFASGGGSIWEAPSLEVPLFVALGLSFLPCVCIANSIWTTLMQTGEDRVLLPEVDLFLTASSLKQRSPRSPRREKEENWQPCTQMPQEQTLLPRTSILVTEKPSTPKLREPCRCQLRFLICTGTRHMARVLRPKMHDFPDPKSQTMGTLSATIMGK